MARLVAEASQPSPPRFFDRLGLGDLRWPIISNLRFVGVVTGGACVMLVGLMIGSSYSSTPSPESMLTTLQPAPISIFLDDGRSQ
jgi:hypothetical protein